ncbi:MAG: bifunctional phosphopantothenoylcysteine decarboxylase/phosphopantothenate--cysteine ligase CoaBC [Methanosarcinaceae archaeon]|nr:bifunctional phosphopantothenoylcysteine decarboxylase/phosphopantothenate--cysteine ligase CoaBC [Methanosarcinaceae archaeon]
MKPARLYGTIKHPTLWIEGNSGDSLKGKTIVLAVTGSIAAVRVIELARMLIRKGASVYGVMSDAATKIIHPDSLEYATGNPVCTQITGNVEHVAFFGSEGVADLLLIAPATANTVSKIAAGIDDTPVTTFATTAIGEGKKVIIVPAMHESMYNHPKVKENIKTLKNMGIDFVGPVFEENIAKISSNESIVLRVEKALHPASPLKGQKILISSGSTAEKIDPIRILTNRASGKTGEALAIEAYKRGAEVYIFRRNNTPIPIIDDRNFKDIRVESATEMTEAVLENIDNEEELYVTGKANILISAAAISDYKLSDDDIFENKIKSGESLTLDFVPTPKLIEEARKKSSELWIVAYKAETELNDEKALSNALKKFREKDIDIDMLIANNVLKTGMGTDTNTVKILKNKSMNEKDLAKLKSIEGTKEKIAVEVLNEIENMLLAEKNAYLNKLKKEKDEKQNDETGENAQTEIEPFTRRRYYEMGDGGAVFISASKRRKKPLKIQGKTYGEPKRIEDK